MIGNMPICMKCVHYNRDVKTLSCKAFPEGIPDDIIENVFDHHFPYSGDHGIQFADNEIKKYGTHEGMVAAWDTRGRGQKEPEEERRERRKAPNDPPEYEKNPALDKFSDDPKKISHEELIGHAQYSEIKTDMTKELGKISMGKEAKVYEVSGKMSPKNADNIIKNAISTTKLHEDYLCGRTANLMRDHIDRLADLIKDPAFADVDSKDMDAFVNDSVQKLMYQEVQSNRQQYTDHGIRHIAGNIDRQEQIMNQMGDTDPREKLMAIAIMINHDVGYDTPLIREGGFRGIVLTSSHPEMSAKIFDEQRDQWNKDKIFSSEEYDRMKEIIKTHDSVELDRNDILATSTRLSDNLSLFSAEKLPGVFQYVPNAKEILVDMANAAKHKDSALFEEFRNELWDNLEKTQLSTNLKRDLKAATRELNLMTPKFNIGTLAGQLEDISYDPDEDKLNVNIRYNEFDHFLADKFEMGQRQTYKLFDAYGVKDFSKDEYDLGEFVHIKINRAK